MIVLAGEVEERVVSAVIAAQGKERDLRVIPIDLQFEVVLQGQLNAVLERQFADLRIGIRLGKGDSARAGQHQQNSQKSHRVRRVKEQSCFVKQTLISIQSCLSLTTRDRGP